MRSFIILFLAMVMMENIVIAQRNQANKMEQIILEREKAFAELVMSRDTNQIKKLQAQSFFLAVGVQGMPLQIIPRNRWIKNLKNYVVHSYSIEEIKVNVYGKTAVALLLFNQKATSSGQDRSAQFVLTDIWVKEKDGWVLAERHSSRPEVAPTK